MKAYCGFGHREVFENIGKKIEEAVLAAIKDGCEVFYTGAMGDFDRLFSSAVRQVKKEYPHIKLICVKPYMTKEINEGGDYLYSLYDDIIIPSSIVGIHYKAAITARNNWMIDNSDTVLFYLRRNYGGAYSAKQYAEKKRKQIICI